MRPDVERFAVSVDKDAPEVALRDPDDRGAAGRERRSGSDRQNREHGRTHEHPSEVMQHGGRANREVVHWESPSLFERNAP
jgi:hypothetical protein